MPIPVIAIFDVGKTNKKLFLFDEQYAIVYEDTIQLPETVDEDGDSCEDLSCLTEWVKNSLERVALLTDFIIKAINFSSYGASMVHIMKEGKSLLPLYNYLKPYPVNFRDEFNATYGGETKIATQTASPITGNLNAGLQLYRIKKQLPLHYEGILKSLHLPQYLSFLVTGRLLSDMTSIGCHSALWDFEKQDYHHWVYTEGIDQKLAPIENGNHVTDISYHGKGCISGIGLHDSSAALIPYLKYCTQPFVLISTGTWCISLNPFNHNPLTDDELQNDCLAYISYEGLPVKASRLFAGYEHEQEVQRLAAHFSKAPDYYKLVKYNADLVKTTNASTNHSCNSVPFASLNMDSFASYEEGYHQLMKEIIARQIVSTNLVLKNSAVKQIYVDGGFGNNLVYMNLLAQAYPAIKVFAATVPQASALGAALAIHGQWNKQPLPPDLIQLKLYSANA